MKRLPIVLLLFVLLANSDAKAQDAVAQFIHGSADPSLSAVDIHIDNLPFIENFSFQQATNYRAIPTSVPFTIDVTLPGGDPATESLYHFDGLANPGLTFTIYLRGVADTTLFSPNPDTNEFRSTSLQFRINPVARESPPGDPQFVWFNFYNGVTDSPSFNVWASEDSTSLSTIGPLHYSAFTGYTSTDRALMVFDRVSPVESKVVESYAFDFSGLPNSTVTIFATGFADTTNNQGGPEIAFHAALADGTVLSSAIVTDSEDEIPIKKDYKALSAYPNPANQILNFDIKDPALGTKLEIFDALGRRLFSKLAEQNDQIAVDHLPNGVYHAVLSSDQSVRTTMFVVRR